MTEHKQIKALKHYIATQGWNWGPGANIPHGEQIVVSDGQVTALVNFWPKRGRLSVQGSASSLKATLEAQVEQFQGQGREKEAASETSIPSIPLPHIGADESGKGDWFGPLVVAAVYVDAATATRLRRIGVRDSKLLEPASLLRLAGQIERIVPLEQRHILAIAPEEYNRRYAQHGNINLLLAEMYAQAIMPVWQVTQADVIVCDQFSQRRDRLDQAFAAQHLPMPIQQHHAESASIAVAAASILAGATFAEALVELGYKAGLDGPLPAGASDIVALKAAARQILARQGTAALERYARLNFKPVQALLNGL